MKPHNLYLANSPRAERAALQKQIEALTLQVRQATDDVSKLRSALPSGAAPTTPPTKPDDVPPPAKVEPPAPAPPTGQ